MALLGAVKRPLCVQQPLPVNVPSWPSAVHSYTHLMLEMQNGKYERSEESVCFQNDLKKLIIDVASAPSHPPLTNGLYSKRQLLKGLDYFYLKFATSFITLYQFHGENQVGVSPGPSVSLFPPPPCCITFLIRVLYDFCRKTKTEVHNSHSECRKIPEPMS